MRLILAQRGSIERYPPVLHQATLFRSLGSVSIVDAPGRAEDLATQTEDDIGHVRVRGIDCGTRDTRLSRLRWLMQFVGEYRRQRLTAPDVAIAFEPNAAALLLKSRSLKQTMRIVHLHEIPDAGLYSSRLSSRLAIVYMLRNLKRADLVVVPDAHRAEFTRKVARLVRAPMVVMNCPPRLREIPQSRLLPWLRERGESRTRIVHYQGSVGPDHALEKIIASMRYWPTDAIFVIIGRATPMYLRELEGLAANEGVLPRVHFVGEVPNSDVFGYAVGAAVGVTLLEPHDKNWEFSAGASNKRFEYPALGIPQVTNAGAGIDVLFSQPAIATVVNGDSIEAIGTAIAAFLRDVERTTLIGQNARTAHLRTYNYEYQFEPVMERIVDWAAKRASHAPR